MAQSQIGYVRSIPCLRFARVSSMLVSVMLSEALLVPSITRGVVCSEYCGRSRSFMHSSRASMLATSCMVSTMTCNSITSTSICDVRPALVIITQKGNMRYDSQIGSGTLKNLSRGSCEGSRIHIFMVDINIITTYDYISKFQLSDINATFICIAF